MRQRQRVDYRDFDPEQGPPQTYSDEDDFDPGSEPENDEDVEMEHLVPSDEDEGIKEENIEIEEPIHVNAKEKKRNVPMDRVPKRFSTNLSPSPARRLPDTAPPVPLQVTEAKVNSYKRERSTAEKIGDRFRYIVGNNPDQLVQAIETRVLWGPVAFIPEKSIMDSGRKFSSDFEPQERVLCPLTAALERESESVEITGHPLTINESTLPPGTTRKTDNVVLINAGSFVKSVAWAPFSSVRLLAVATIPSDRHPIDCDATDPSLSSFGSASSKSVLQFYGSDLEPLAVINCGNHGPIVKMEWRPISESRELAVLFQNGQLVLIPAPGKGTHNLRITESLKLDTRITSFCWGSEDNILCGTIDGYVAEFDMNDYEFPLYYQPLHLSLIHDISASLGSPNKTICTTSPDGDSKVTDRNNLSKSIPIIRGRSFLPNTRYLYQLNSYVTQDDHIISRLLLAHTPSMPSGTQLTMHDGSINALSTSLLHPFVLSGSTDGTLAIVNAARRAFVPRRNLKDEKSVILWGIQCNERTKSYTMTELLKTSLYQAKVKAPTQLVMSPQTCTVTAIDWDQCRERCNWYCAATAGGLLRVEKLD